MQLLLVPVALTSRAAADLGLVRGDRIEVNAFGVRFPAEVAELVDWVPSVAGERALLVDSAALGASKAAPKPVTPEPEGHDIYEDGAIPLPEDGDVPLPTEEDE